MGFTTSMPQLLVVLAVLLIANIFYSYVIINKPYNLLSRIFSLLLIWMLPVIGIVAVAFFTKVITPTNT